MTAVLLANEPAIRLAFFFGVQGAPVLAQAALAADKVLVF